LYTVAVGSAPAHGLMQALAASTRGTARTLASIEDVPTVARAFAFDCDSVAQLPTVNWGTLAVTQQSPTVLPRLGVGQALLVTGRLATATTATIQVAGLDVGLIRRASHRARAGALSKHGQLARQWARGQLQAMNPWSAGAVALAQRYGVVTAGVALVAARDVITVPGGTAHSVAIPVDAPADQVRWREEILQVDAAEATTLPVTPPVIGPDPALAQPVAVDVRTGAHSVAMPVVQGAVAKPDVVDVRAAPVSPHGATVATPDSDDTDAEPPLHPSADAPSAASLQEVVPGNEAVLIGHGWRRTLTLALGLGARTDVTTEAAGTRYAGALSGLVAGSYLWGNRWSLGGEVGLVARWPNATVLARPLITVGRADRNARTSLQLGLGYQAALAPTASGAIDASAFAASLMLRVRLVDLDLLRWSVETRLNTAINGNGFSNDISVGVALHW
ncbi:MAG: hypothetical protein KBG15_12640, partial [Kofleriaceae bacterium]|nr:hypothetical protein [Kofleriaceae bacterium]